MFKILISKNVELNGIKYIASFTKQIMKVFRGKNV